MKSKSYALMIYVESSNQTNIANIETENLIWGKHWQDGNNTSYSETPVTMTQESNSTRYILLTIIK